MSDERLHVVRPAPQRWRIRPSPDQRQVIDHGRGRLRVLAGPGTGKTATIVEAVAERIEGRGVPPGEILVLTFSRRAARELSGRIAARLEVTVSEPMVRTVHSFAYAVVRQAAGRSGDPPPRLLEAGQADLVVRDLLAGHAEAGGGRWPAELLPALRIPAFAAELREMMARLAEQRITPRRIAALADRLGRPEWRAVAEFIDEYRDVSDLRSGTVRLGAALDQAELTTAALDRLTDPVTLASLQERIRRVFVDEYQDVDPAQARLIELVAGAADELVVVGDPDQAIYAFRGATPGAMHRAEVDREVALTVSRRMRPALIAATRRVAALLPGVAAHRELRPTRSPASGYDDAPGQGVIGGGARNAAIYDASSGDGASTSAGPPGDSGAAGPSGDSGSIEARVLARPGQEAAYVADYLRRAHLHRGVPWGQMAVLLRSPRAAGDVFRRALAHSGVPVVAGSTQAVATDPLVAALLAVLRAGIHPESLTATVAGELMTSPLGGLDPLTFRELRRAVRSRSGSAGSSATILAGILRGDTPAPRGLPRDLGARLQGMLELVRLAREGAQEPAAESVLWRIWQAAGLATGLEAASLRGGTAGLRADAQLDAVIELFDRAADLAVQIPSAGIVGLLDLLAEETIAPGQERGREADAVTILSAHAAKGLEWDVVALAGVQEETWPDLRPRASLLGLDELIDAAADIRAPRPLAARLAEERRLFYVAATRARRELLVTAVSDDELTPSRFVEELVPAEEVAQGWPPDIDGRDRRQLTMPSLVADLRRAVTEDAADGDRAQAAAECLGVLARRRVPGADPGDWYGLAPLSTDGQLIAEGEPVRLSPSQWESARQCPLRTVLDRQGGSGTSSPAQLRGVAVHALAEGLAAGADEATISAAIDEFIAAQPELPPWESAQLRRRITAMYQALESWVREHRDDRRRIASEVLVDLTIPAGGDHPVQLRGRIDWLSRDEEDRLVITDFKTGSTMPSPKDMGDHAQLAAYQLAVALGGLAIAGTTDAADVGNDPEVVGAAEDSAAAVGGAELIYLAKGKPMRRSQDPLDESRTRFWLGEAQDAARNVSGSSFLARVGTHCERCPVRSSCPVQPEGRQVTR